MYLSPAGERLTLPPVPLDAAAIPPLPSIPFRSPQLRVALPTGEQASLPGVIWPELAAAQPRRARGRGGRIPKPIVDVVEIDIRQADRLLAEFHHPLPPASRRPFGRMSFALRAFEEPVAVCVSASAPNASVHQDHGLHRHNTVELARIGRRDPPATLAALRVWRTYLAPLFAERYAGAGWGAHTLRAVRRAVRRRGLGSAHAASSDHLLAPGHTRERAQRARHLPPRRMNLHPPPPAEQTGPQLGMVKALGRRAAVRRDRWAMGLVVRAAKRPRQKLTASQGRADAGPRRPSGVRPVPKRKKVHVSLFLILAFGLGLGTSGGWFGLPFGWHCCWR